MPTGLYRAGETRSGRSRPPPSRAVSPYPQQGVPGPSHWAITDLTGTHVNMLDASTPLTVGLFFVAACGFTASTTFLFWLWRQMRGLKEEILALVQADTERTSKALDRVATQVGAVDAKAVLLNERVHALELALVTARAEFAERYMSKESATGAIGRVETAVTDMKRDIGDRLVSIEQHLRREVPGG